MDADAIREGLTVTVTSDRAIGGRSHRGERGVVWSTALRDRIEDWVLVDINAAGEEEDLIGLRPDEIESAEAAS